MDDVKIAETLMTIAEDLVTDVTLTFEREADKESTLNVAYKDIQSFMERIRRNEGMESFCLRRDSSEEMEVRLGLSDHESKEAIVGAIKDKAEKLARRMGLRLKGMESDMDAAGAVERHVKEILRVAKGVMGEDDPMAKEKLSKLFLKFHTWATKLTVTRTGPIAIQILDGMSEVEKRLKGKTNMTGREAVKEILKAQAGLFVGGSQPMSYLMRKYGREEMREIADEVGFRL